MTVRELKSYIREVASRVGKNTSSSMKAVASHAKMIVREFGTYRRNRQTYMKLGLSHARKAELIEKAQKLRSFAKTYTTNREARRKRNARAEKAHHTFEEHYGKIEFDEWEMLFEAMRELGSLFEKYASTLIKLYIEYRSKGVTPRKFVDVILQAEKELIEERITLNIRTIIDRTVEILDKQF